MHALFAVRFDKALQQSQGGLGVRIGAVCRGEGDGEVAAQAPEVVVGEVGEQLPAQAFGA